MFFDWKFLDYNIKFWHYRWLDFVCPIVPLQTLSEPFLQKGGFEWHLLQPTGCILPTICSQDWSFLNLNLTPGRGMCKHLHIIQLYRPVWDRVNTLSLCAICFFIINVLNNNILSFFPTSFLFSTKHTTSIPHFIFDGSPCYFTVYCFHSIFYICFLWL